MNEVGIGKLQRVALREVWKHEAYDFTRWLQENIDVLNEALGLSLINVEREQAAGSFSIDLVAEDEGGFKVIIENQLEKSNHDHLGKLLTYFAAMEARAGVWIVSEPRPEHVAVIAWLNESSSADFYLTLIVGPSAETEAVSKSKREFAEREDIRKAWWARVVAQPEAKLHRHLTPGVAAWIGATSGVRGLNLNFVVLQDECAAELYIDRGNGADVENKSIYDQLFAHKDAIESAFGGALEWQRLDAKRASRVRITIPGGYRAPDEEWDPIQQKQVAAMNRLNMAIQPFLRGLKLGA